MAEVEAAPAVVEDETAVDAEQEGDGEQEHEPEPEREPEPETSPEVLREMYAEVSFKDPLFPYSNAFTIKSRKEKEMQFLKAFEEQTLFIRNKELKCVNSPMEALLDTSQVSTLVNGRQSALDGAKKTEQRKAITRRVTEANKTPAPRVDVTETPTFNGLLNVNFESQFSLLEKFKGAISQLTVRNRANKRSKLLAQSLISASANAVKSLQEEMHEKAQLTAHSLLSLGICFRREAIKFSEPTVYDLPVTPDVHVSPHNVEKPFSVYVPGTVERFQLTPFVRTDVTSYVSAPIALPDHFPVVREEQPVCERVVPSLDLTDEKLKEKPVNDVVAMAPATIPKVVRHPREIRYYSFDPAYPLRPQPIELPDVPDEIGRSSMLSLPLAEYEKMSLAGKTKTPFAPFEFVGVVKFAQSGLNPMEAADPIDLRELEADDDIDGIDIQPKVRPITDFLTKQLNTKNKSHVLAEAVTEGQSQWCERQRKGVSELIDSLSNINKLMRDTSLSIPLDDLQEYMKQ